MVTRRYLPLKPVEDVLSGYTKLFSTIVTSTIWLESAPTKVVWITMLALADRDGIVEGSVPGLARLAGVTREECHAALDTFMSPDPDSRSKEHEGRRIEDVAGGWRLLNHAVYRERLKAESATGERHGKIYFIECDNLIKIGFSANPWARCAALRTGMSSEPKLLGVYSATLLTEKELHRKFADLRHNREWYRDDPLIRAFIAEKCPNATVVTGSDIRRGSNDPKLQYAEAEAEAEAKEEAIKNPPAREAAPPGLDASQLARTLLEDLKLLRSTQNMRIAMDAIRDYAKDEQVEESAAFEHIRKCGLDDQTEGIEINTFWFNDTRYGTNRGKSHGQQHARRGKQATAAEDAAQADRILRDFRAREESRFIDANVAGKP